MRNGNLVRFMATRKSNWLAPLAIVLSVCVSNIASAQSIEDWPSFKGSNARTGRNGDPTSSGPGKANLRWWTPNGVNAPASGTYIVDNTDIGSTSAYGLNPNGVFSTTGASWLPSPSSLGGSNNNDASNPWIEYDPVNVYNERVPSYIYSSVTAATSTSDPTSGATASATWQLNPTAGAGNYGVYVWFPSYGQQVNGTYTYGTLFPVVQVAIKNNLGNTLATYTEIIDRTVFGGGWVRIGNSGFDSTGLHRDNASLPKVFPYDGSGSITVTVFNTVPYIPLLGTGTAETNLGNKRVYADAAMAVPQSGYYDSSPVSAQLTVGSPATTRTVAAVNQLTTSIQNGTFKTIATGVVTSYQYDTGAPVWTYTPVQESSLGIQTDNTTASVTNGFVQDTVTTRYSGAYASVAPITALAPTDSVTYTPTLVPDTYQIYLYVPGNNNGRLFGQAVLGTIFEGTTATNFTVDETLAAGWVKIGTGRYTNTVGSPLKVTLTNGTTNPADIGLKAYANAIKFVGSTSQAITSTPVIATVGIKHPDGTTVQTQVDIIVDETGVIHCLDATGNGDGTTTEYWSYPSTLDSSGNDPNQTASLDLGAAMPQGFNMSSALVQTIGGVDYLYIASNGGRVYCINMAGRGDYLSATRRVGTTNRVWTFPATSPSAKPLPALSGGVGGSVVYGAPNGKPTIFVPAGEGRVYALDAVGNADLSTNILWAYPKVNSVNLTGIANTPAYEFGNLYFGTIGNDTNNGQLICLDVTNLAGGNPTVKWAFSGDNLTRSVGTFLSSPAVVPYQLINGGVATNGLVYASNQNTYVYAFDALSGAIAWRTSELNNSAQGALTFTQMTTYDNSGNFASIPVIMVPTRDGRFDGLFADPATTNQYSTRRAYEFNTASPQVKSTLAVSNQWMYGTDESGYLYAFNDGSGYLSPGDPPGGQTIVENNPAGAIFRNAKLKLLTRDGYNLLRLPTGSNLNYNDAVTKYTFTRNPLAFEWGEHVYILVYDFPFITSNGASTVPPPVVNITFSSQGRTLPANPVMARLFKDPTTAPLDPSDPSYHDDGYAIMEYTIASGQNQQLVPGPGTISFTMSSGALNSGGTPQNIALNPAQSNFGYLIANPLALAMPAANGTYADATAIGLSVNPSDAENLVNGNPKLPGTTKQENLLGQGTPIANHGNSASANVFVIDRTMVAMNSGDNQGLTNVQVDLRNLGWQGGHLAIYKPLPLPYYANFEDYPDNYPNNSLDYPDILSDQVQVTKDPNGTPENPRFNGVTLLPALIKDPVSGQVRPMQLGDDPANRVLQPTPFAFTVNVPRFQPANTNAQVSNAGALVTNSAGAYLNQGYMGRAKVYVGVGQSGFSDPSQVDSYRSFNLSTSVDVDEKLAVTTPTVDLGTLPGGAGYDPLMPGSNYDPSSTASLTSSVFQPWAGYYSKIFQPFTVVNLGNSNLLNVRVAKAAQLPPTGSSIPIYNPWGFYSDSNDLLGFVDGSLDLWSNIDATFAPEGSGPNRTVALQKARVSDVSGASLNVNPIRRANANLGTTGTFTVAGQTYQDVLNQTVVGGALRYQPGPPVIGVSIPLGMPAGSYSNTVEVIEKNSLNEIWQVFNNAPEAAANPGFTLNFKVRESQLTSNFTTYSAPMIDSGVTQPNALAPLAYSNRQPTMVRDPFGSLVMAFSSDRPSWNSAQPTATTQLGNYSLYIATVGNSASYSSTGITGTPDAFSPLSDLNAFVPASSGQWFRQAISNYPSMSADALFGSQTGESIIAGTVQYGNPSFPQSGLKNPYNPAQTFNAMLMAFTGDAQKQTPSGRLGESKLFMSILTLAGGGTASITPQPVVLAADPQVAKGKPSVVQTANGAMVFYPGASGSQSNIFYTIYGNGGSGTPSFTDPIALPFGSGFQSVSSPSASARIYNGTGEFRQTGGSPVQQLAANDKIVELTFTGLLRGRSNPEVFFGRMRVDPNALVVVDDNGLGANNPSSDGNVFLDLNPVVNESLTATGQSGLYRALGVMWERSGSIQLYQVLNGASTNLIIPNTAAFDQQSGLISCDSRLGGKIYFDVTLGTVRFSGAVPSKNADLLVSYTPRFLRISTGVGQGYTKATGLYDARETSNVQYWRLKNGAQATFGDDIQNGRYVYTYNRASGGSGLPPRPFLSTLRLGIQLGFRIACDNTGAPQGVVVTGARGPYQIDPANGRIYFTDLDEDNTVSVSYLALLETGTGTTTVNTGNVSVSLVREVAEQQIMIDNAVNESDLTAFLDPFSFINQRRPPLIWLLWTSSRSGVPDVYFESIAPQWSPVSVSK